MCGISGEAGLTVALPSVHRATNRQTHRGSDASAVRQWNRCLLGRNVWRIIDLSPEADQPLANEDGAVCVVFNGEIYNFPELRADLESAGHRFRTHTDTEVLVHLYEEHGPRLVARLRGMVAFALWDDRAQRLLLVRDRLGIKPLYNRRDGDGLRFASEMCAFRDASQFLDPAAVAAYLRLGRVPGSRTVVAGIEELPPGHLLESHDGQTVLGRWWQPPYREPDGIDAEVEPLADVLADAFRRHLVADVPVGSFPSSGVYSLVLAYLAARAGADLTGYTVAFDSGPDEAREAAAAARHLGLAHEATRVSSAQVLADLPRIVAAHDQPSVDGVNTWAISRAVRQAGLTVALSGLGGDELFAGYSTFRRVPRMVRVGQLVGGLAGSVRTALGRAAQRLPRHQLRRAAEAAAAGGWAAAYAAMRGVTGAAEHVRVSGGIDGDGLTGLFVETGLNDLGTVTHLELLAPGDPEGRRGKARLAAAVYPELLARVDRPKQTFTLPFDRWLDGPLADPDVRLIRAELAA